MNETIKVNPLLTSEQLEELNKELAELVTQPSDALEPVATQLVRVTEHGELEYTDEAFDCLEETAWRWMLNCKIGIATRYLQRHGLDPDLMKPENQGLCFQLMEAWADVSEDATRAALTKATSKAERCLLEPTHRSQ